MRRFGWLVALTTVVGGAPYGRALEAVKEAPVAISTKDNGIGTLVDDLSFTDLDGKSGKLSDFKASKGLVVCMTSASCPLAKKYGPTLVELEKAYRAKGVAFVAINVAAADPAERVNEAAAQLTKSGWGGRYVADPQGKIAGALGATTTTEVFVLDRARTLAYRGAIDDQYGLGYALDQPKRRYLVRALDAVLAGEKPPTQATTAPGCAVAFAAPIRTSPVTYHNRISRIVETRCLECHRKGENGPFELATYADVTGNAAMIKKVVAKRTMPPWFAEPLAGHPYRNDRSLTDREKADLVKWIEAGAPEGNAADGPVPAKFADGWRIGKPDA